MYALQRFAKNRTRAGKYSKLLRLLFLKASSTPPRACCIIAHPNDRTKISEAKVRTKLRIINLMMMTEAMLMRWDIGAAHTFRGKDRCRDAQKKDPLETATAPILYSPPLLFLPPSSFDHYHVKS